MPPDPEDPLIPMPWQMEQIRAYRAQQAAEAQKQAEQDELRRLSLEKAKLDRQFINQEVDINGKKVNIRELANFNPEWAATIQQDELDEYMRYRSVQKVKQEAEMAQAMSKIMAAQEKIKQEQAKTPVLFGIGGPSQKVIDEQKRIIDNESQTYGIPLGSEPEGAEPTPATQTGAASTWLRSKLK